MTELSIAPDFVEAAHAIVYCGVATVDRASGQVPGDVHRPGSGTGSG